MNLEQTFCALESTTGLTLTLYDLRRRLMENGLPWERKLHHTPFCKSVKKMRERQCVICDQERVFTECLNNAAPFIRTCHAGADELIIPVFHGGELLLVGFLGQFLREGRADFPMPRHPALPVISPEDAGRLVCMGDILRGFLTDLLADAGPDRRPLSNRIHSFISDHLSSDPGLDDLAEEMGLSSSRTRHLVKEACGKPFSQVKNSIRLAVATDMLVRTNASLAFVASQAGFNDVDYFCRFFKKHIGMTAGEYRNGVIREGTTVRA